MKFLFHLLLMLCYQPAIAQSDSTFYGVYTNADKSVTYLFMEPVSQTMYMDVMRKTDKNPDDSDYGSVGFPSNGRHPMQIRTNGDRESCWIAFKIGTDGRKSAVTTTTSNVSETFLFSDDQSWYEEYTNFVDSESADEQPTDEADGEYTIAGYQREDGATLILDFATANGVKVLLTGSPEESCEEDHFISGTLQSTGENKYIFQVDHCTVHFTVESDHVTITEENCSKSHPKGCKAWKGIYQLDM